jgi:hypothetical protein
MAGPLSNRRIRDENGSRFAIRSCCLPQRVFRKSLHDVGHPLLKVKVVLNTARYHRITAARCLYPFTVDKQADHPAGT